MRRRLSLYHPSCLSLPIAIQSPLSPLAAAIPIPSSIGIVALRMPQPLVVQLSRQKRLTYLERYSSSDAKRSLCGKSRKSRPSLFNNFQSVRVPMWKCKIGISVQRHLNLDLCALKSPTFPPSPPPHKIMARPSVHHCIGSINSRS